MKKLKVFVDSNIWFSAFYKTGSCSQLLKLLTDQKHKIIINEQVLEEIIRNIKIKIPSALPLIIEYINQAKPIVVKNPRKPFLEKYKNLSHHKDLPIVIAAINYKCHYFITGNLADFNINQTKKLTVLKILSPSRFISSYPNL